MINLKNSMIPIEYREREEKIVVTVKKIKDSKARD